MKADDTTGGRRADSLGKVLGILADRARRSDDTVTLGVLLHELGPRAYGPLLLVPAVLALIPVIGAIPGVSIVTGTLIMLVAAQMLVGRDRPWMPQALLDLSLPQRRLTEMLERAQRWARPVDRVVRHRYVWLTRPPGLQVVALVLMLIALLFYPTALIPWGVTPPALAAFLLALAVTAQDGLLALVGLAVATASLWLAEVFWPF